MIVVGPNYASGHIPSAEYREQEKQEDVHRRDFVLWAMRRRAKPWSREDVIDAYERYLESLGANRTQRRKAVDKFSWSIGPTICIELCHREHLLKEGPVYSFTMNAAGKKAAKGMKAPPVPDWWYKKKA